MKDKIDYALNILKQIIGGGKHPFKSNSCLIVCDEKYFNTIEKLILEKILFVSVADRIFNFRNGWTVELFNREWSYSKLITKEFGVFIKIGGLHYDSVSSFAFMNEKGILILWV